MRFLKCCTEFEHVADFPIWKGALVDRLMAMEPGQEEIVRNPDDGAKDKASGVELSSSRIRSSGD